MAPDATPPTATPPAASPASSAAAAPVALKKGSLVRVNRQSYQGSLEAGASDADAPGYIFEGPGEVLLLKGDYAQLRWRRPVPDVWLRLDQLEAYPG
jgi:hypothetical protein